MPLEYVLRILRIRMGPILKNLEQKNKNLIQLISAVTTLASILVLLLTVNTKKIIAEIRKNTVPW